MRNFLNGIRPGSAGLYSLLLTLVSLIFVQLYTGYFIAWIDDLWLDQCMKGQLMSPPFSKFFMYMPIISTLIKKLYLLVPGMPWFGLFGLLIFIMILVNFYYLAFHLFKPVRSIYFRAIISLSLFVVIVYDSLYLFSLTRAGLLLMGISLINFWILIDKAEMRRGLYLFVISSFLTGVFTRFPTFIFMTGFAGITLLVFNKEIFRKQHAVAISLFVIIAVIPIVNSAVTASGDFHKRHIGILNILDSKLSQINMSAIEDPVLYARTYALYTWFLGDAEIWDQETLDDIAEVQELQNNVVRLRDKIRSEINKSKSFYTSDYCPRLNWFGRSLMSVIVSLLLIIYHLVRRPSEMRGNTGIHLLLFILTFTGLFMTLIFYKMEDRVFSPMLFVLILFQLYMLSRADIRPGRILGGTAMFLLLAAAVFRMAEYHSNASFKKAELHQKKEAVRELSEISDVNIIMTDFYSNSLFHGSLFTPYSLPENARYLSFKEFWGSVSPPHYEELRDICGTDQFLDFFKCLYDQKESVRFVYLTVRIDMLENYFPAVYGEEVRFNRLDGFDAVDSIHYSFLWLPLEFGVYEFADSFNDAAL